MGRKGALEIKMTSGKVLRFLSERPDSKAKMVVCERYIEKLFKSKHSDRKKEYKEQVTNIMKYLVRDSTDFLEMKEKLRETKKRLEHESEKRANLQDRNLKLQMKVREIQQLRKQLEKERAMRIKCEGDYGKLLATCSEDSHSSLDISTQTWISYTESWTFVASF